MRGNRRKTLTYENVDLDSSHHPTTTNAVAFRLVLQTEIVAGRFVLLKISTCAMIYG